jgi:hypothetical protein
MASIDRHDMLSSPIDDPMNTKSPSFGMESSPFFEYNQISDAFNSFHGYEHLSHLSQSPTEYTGLHIGMADLSYAPMDSSSIYAPQRPYTPIDSITPSLTHLSPQMLSASELSGDGGAHSSRRSSTGSPDSNRGGAPLPPAHGRAPSSSGTNSTARYNPLSSSSTTRASRASTKKRSKQEDSDDDDDDADFQPSSSREAGANSPDKREEIRKQRIESEQRRRDELREGYRRLKDALPASNQKSSKVSLLDRAVTHIRYMEMTRQNLQARLNAAEMETQRLRQVNEALMLGTAEQRAAAAAASAAVQAQVQSSY